MLSGTGGRCFAGGRRGGFGSPAFAAGLAAFDAAVAAAIAAALSVLPLIVTAAPAANDERVAGACGRGRETLSAE